MKTVIKAIVLMLIGQLMVTNACLATNYSNEKYDWYFKRSKGNEPATTEPEYQKLLDENGGIFIGNTNEKVLYLTFDNGYENGYTEPILDILKEKKVPAAFFVTGHYLDDQPKLIKRMVEEGHIVGNHSWSHPDLTNVGDEKLKAELDKVKQKFTEMTGVKEMNYLRPPRGVFSERTLALSNQLGYTNVFWSLAYKDWETNKQKGWKYAYDNILKQVHPGSILLLHTVSKDNAEALEKVIDELRKQGYTFKSLNDLMLENNMPDLY
ncbi:delta-lactam-biosynthetic de-N-acetylase [Bacillus taeanensis]|uniref:Delta-lactam-biosynthetic de-N-acetylase n=2 Tax=Bacillus taeanensis TaxID=273032 RepID=A0A366XRI7_9BACI|nr:delta-lactam-biosynthetic de-N-acetylase [Bacillus taeanensis]